MELRPYQKEAIQAVFDWWRVEQKYGENPLVVLPTASGKTVIFCSLIQQMLSMSPDIKVLVLAHRKELVSQAEEKLLMIWPDAPVGVFAASLGRREVDSITIASRDTIINHLDKLGKIDIILVDEAHHVSPRYQTRYRQIFNELQRENKNLHVIGVTATPYRKGQGFIYGKNSEKYLFNGVAYEATIPELIEKGYLTPVVSKKVNETAVAELSGVKTTGGDFNLGDLEGAVSQENIIKACIDEWRDLAADRKATVFFCVTVKHAEMVQEELRTQGFDFPLIEGKTPTVERESILADFQAGKFRGLVNVVILTEGWDAPVLDCICLMRPTKSLSLYLQIVGRGLRLFEGKKNTLLLDFGGCLERFGPIDKARPEQKGNGEPIMKVCPECEAYIYAGFVHCPECNHHFKSLKPCPSCQVENNSRNVHCFSCGALLRELQNKASDRSVLSQDTKTKIVEIPVESVELSVSTSYKTKKKYLSITFRCGLVETYVKRLMIGYSGWAGVYAVKKWCGLLAGGETFIPETPEQAVTEWRKRPEMLKTVESIAVDLNSQYQEVKGARFTV